MSQERKKEQCKSGDKQIRKNTKEEEFESIRSEYKYLSLSEHTELIDNQNKMIKYIIRYFDKDRDGGLNFVEFQEMIQNLPDSIININNYECLKWKKWCDMSHKFGFENPRKSIFKKYEVWSFFLETSTIIRKLRNEPFNGYHFQYAYCMAVCVWHEIQKRNDDNDDNRSIINDLLHKLDQNVCLT